MDGRYSLNGTGLSNPVAESTHINGRHSISQNFPWGVSSGSPKAKLNGHHNGGTTRCNSLNRTIISPLKTRIDPLVYADVKAKGFTSRIAQYHENGKRLIRSSSVGGNGYYKTGQFPIVHLDGNKGIPYKAARTQVSMTRIAPPKDSVLYGNTISSLLRSSSIVGLQKTDEDLLHENRPILHPPPTENDLAPTRSLIDVLHEISRKRINSDDPLINEGTKKSCTNDYRDFVDSGKVNDMEPAMSTTFKRQRENLNGVQGSGISPTSYIQQQAQQNSPEQIARKRYCSHHNDITSSLSSSVTTHTSKRKLLSNTSISPTHKALNTSSGSNNSKESDIGDKQQSKIYKNNHTDNEKYYEIIAKTKSCNLPMQSLAISGNTERQFQTGYQQYNQTNNLQGAAVSRTVSAPVKGIEQSVKEIPLPTKPKLTLFNTNYTNKEKSSGNIASDPSSGDDDDDDDDDEGAGIQFIKPKKLNGPMSTKNPLIEKTKQSKLAALLAGLKGELYQEDVPDSAPQTKKPVEQTPPPKATPTTAALSLAKDKDSLTTAISAASTVANNNEKAKEPVAAVNGIAGGGFQFNAASKPTLPAFTSTNTATTVSTSLTMATSTSNASTPTTTVAKTVSTTAEGKPASTPGTGVISTPNTSTTAATPLGGFSFKPLIPNSQPSSTASASTTTNTVSQTISTSTVAAKSLGGFSFASSNNTDNNSTVASSNKPEWFSFGLKTSSEASIASSTSTTTPATQGGFSFAAATAASKNSTQNNMIANNGSTAPAAPPNKPANDGSTAPAAAPTNAANLFNFGQTATTNNASAAFPAAGAASKPVFSFGGNSNNAATNANATATTTATASAVTNSGPTNANTSNKAFVFGNPGSSTSATTATLPIVNSGSSAFSAPKTFEATPNAFGSNVVAPAATKPFSFGANPGANASSSTSTSGAPATNTFSFGSQAGNTNKPTGTATPFSFSSNTNNNNNSNASANNAPAAAAPAPAPAPSIFAFGNNNSNNNNNNGNNLATTTTNIFGSNASSTNVLGPTTGFNNATSSNNIFGGSSAQNQSQLSFGKSPATTSNNPTTNSNSTPFSFGAAAGATTNNDNKSTFSFNSAASASASANGNNNNTPGVRTFGQNTNMNQNQSGSIFGTNNNNQSSNTTTTIFNANGPKNNTVQGAFNFGSNANSNNSNAPTPAFGANPNKSFSFNNNTNNNNNINNSNSNSNPNGTNIFGSGFGGNNNNNSNNGAGLGQNSSNNNAFVFGGAANTNNIQNGPTTNAFGGQPANNNNNAISKPTPFAFGANNSASNSIFGGINNNNTNNGQNKAFTFSASSNNNSNISNNGQQSALGSSNQPANIFGNSINGNQTPTFNYSNNNNNPMTSANTPNGNIFAPPNPAPGERHIRRATRRLQK